MSTQVVEEKDVGKVEDILGDVIAEVEAEESAISPAEEAEIVADFNPLENPKVLSRVKSLHRALMKMRDVDFWRNDGTSKYLAYFVTVKDSARRNSIFGIHLAKNRARGTLKRASEDGKKNMGDVGIRISESGLIIDDESITQKELLKRIVSYRRARGWE